MITYFPRMYPDELFYSVLSRAYLKGGYLTHTQATEEFFNNPKERFDFQFVNGLRPEIVHCICQKENWEQVIINHTLFPYYSRFLGKEKKSNAFEALKHMEGDYNNLLSLTPNRKEERFLRYCPLCAIEQRQRYGESYWSRIHQIPDINVCPIHGCKLRKSSISMNRHKTNRFAPADMEIIDLTTEYGTEIEYTFSQYLYQLLSRDVVWDNDIHVSKLLISNMAGTRYLSCRGEVMHTASLYQDIILYYHGMCIGIDKEWQLSKVLHGQRINPVEIAQIGMLLGISAEEISGRIELIETPEELFDNKVIELLQQGLSTKDIATKFHVSQSLIRLIAKNHSVDYKRSINRKGIREKAKNERIIKERQFWERVLKNHPGLSFTQLCEIPEYRLRLRWLRRNDRDWTEEHYPEKSTGSRQIQLSKLDTEYFPKVKGVLYEFGNKNGEMPKRVTINAISKSIGINGRLLYHLPKCRNLINEYTESNEQYWARKVVWATKQILNQDKKLNWTNIRKISGINDKRNILKCYPLLKYYADDIIYEELSKLPEIENAKK